MSQIAFEKKDELIEYLTELAGEGECVFRGYSKQSEIIPSLLRENLVDYENELLTDFERYGSQHMNVSNHIDLMAYAQHFGLPTRLLDFTFNPFIALYFALFKQKTGNYTYSEDGDWYYIKYAKLSQNVYTKKASVEADVEMLQQTYTFSDLAIKYIKQIEEEFSNNNKTCLFFVDPAQSNQRLVMQQGLFMFPYVLDQEEHKNIIESNTKLLKIGKKLRSELQGYLDTLGLNAFRLMPDLASVCEAVKRNVKKNG